MLSIKQLAPTGRVQRRPKHKFAVRHKPFVIQPFAIAPVLPAETLNMAMIQSRAITDPLASPLIGWTLEHSIFFVKIRDLNERDTLDDLFINPTANVSALNSAASDVYYHPGNSPNYTSMALRRIVETYFRNEGETWNNADVGGMPTASVLDQMWMDSLVDTTDLADGGVIPAGSTGEATDKLLDAYEYLRSMSLTKMSFEDYCRTFGVTISRSEVHKPELIHRWREWTYPSNTIDPLTGAPTSACSWAVEQVTRDKKLFKEPGFIVGVTLARPKVYFQNLKGSLAHFLDNGLSWLPAIMRDQPETSLREFAKATGPVSGPPTNDYWVDMRDLFLYGDQFVNFLKTDAASNLIGGPTAALVRRFVTSADIDECFKSGSANLVKQDGVLSLHIAGAERDMTGSPDQ